MSFNKVKDSSLYNLVVILGPTASGKKTLAAHLAYQIEGEIISADSRQVYKMMDIGTGKDLKDYVVNGENVPYHLIDIAEAGSKYNVYQYQTNFFEAFADVQSRNRWPVMCGGTGMYIEAVLSRFKMVHVPSNPDLRKSMEGKNLAELT